MDLDVDVADRRGFTVVGVRGEVDLYTAPLLHEKLADLVAAGRCNVVVDLEGVEFIDSTGLSVLVTAAEGLRTGGGDLQLVCTHQRILKVLAITGLTGLFTVHASQTAVPGLAVS